LYFTFLIGLFPFVLLKVGVGTRRFAKSNSVGRSWLSATEQVEATAQSNSKKLSSFAKAMVPAPVLGALCPGPLEFKAIVATAAGAAQAAYYLTTAEYEVGERSCSVL
jgi:hypothetical protein